jgi:Archaeal adenylate kinase
MKIVLVAVPGSGKTTIMNLVKQRLPDVKIINYGDVMLEIARQRFGIQHRDEMRKKIPVDEYRKIQEEAAEYIASLPGDVIIDTHASIKIIGGYYPGLPNRVISKLKPEVILLIEYDPKAFLKDGRKTPKGLEMPSLKKRLKCINRQIDITRLPRPTLEKAQSIY